MTDGLPLKTLKLFKLSFKLGIQPNSKSKK